MIAAAGAIGIDSARHTSLVQAIARRLASHFSGEEEINVVTDEIRR